jgi:hypothetical protein
MDAWGQEVTTQYDDDNNATYVFWPGQFGLTVELTIRAKNWLHALELLRGLIS